MDSKKLVEIFNANFIKFIDDLVKLYPNDKDMKTFKLSFRMITNVADKKPMEFFNNLVVQKYGEQIDKKDEQFFLNKDYEELKSVDENVTTELINKIKSYWKDISSADKEVVWKYITLLTALNRKYYSQ